MAFSGSFEFAGVNVGKEGEVLVIAEAGVAHFGDSGKMDALIDMSVEAGADVFKTQAYVTEAMISSALPDWQDRMKTKEVTPDFLERAKARCESKGLTFMCTAHDERALEWIDGMEVEAYKIGSGECSNLPFISKIARRNKPVFLSTGMYSLKQIDQTVAAVQEAGCHDFSILHCITAYPTPVEAVNLRAIPFLADRFASPVGYSDHTVDHTACIGAVALGARVIEKHITLEFNIPNAQDWRVSCGPEDFPAFVRNVKNAARMRGDLDKTVQDCEADGQNWAIKRLVARKDLSVGHTISEEDLIAKRCSDGVRPDQMAQIIGKTLLHTVEKDHPVTVKILK